MCALEYTKHYFKNKCSKIYTPDALERANKYEYNPFAQSNVYELNRTFDDEEFAKELRSEIFCSFDFIETSDDYDKCDAVIFTFEGDEFKTGADAYLYRKKFWKICDDSDSGVRCYFTQLKYLDMVDVMDVFKNPVYRAALLTGEKCLALICKPGTAPIGYIIQRKRDCFRLIDSVNAPAFSNEWKEEIVQKFGVKFMIACYPFLEECLQDVQKAVECLEPLKCVDTPLINECIDSEAMSIALKANKLFEINGMTDRYLVFPPIGRFRIQMGSQILLETTSSTKLPFHKRLIVESGSSNDSRKIVVYFAYLDRDFELLEQISFIAEFVEIFFRINCCQFYDINVKSCNPEDYEKDITSSSVCSSLPETEPQSKTDNVEVESFKMIFSKNDFTVHLPLGNGQFQHLKLENLDSPTPLYIAFNEEQPVIGEAAKKLIQTTHKEFVVFDLIKICSIESDEDIMDYGTSDFKRFNRESFKVVKENDQVIVKMKCHKGPGRARNFGLLAMILMAGVNLAEEAFGKKLKKIEIDFWMFEADEILKKNFVAAGKFLGFDIVFV